MGGDKPIGLIVGLVATTTLALLPAIIVPAYYLFASGYALLTGTDFSSDTMNVAVFLTGLVLIVAFVIVGMAIAISIVGRALTPKKRRHAQG